VPAVLGPVDHRDEQIVGRPAESPSTCSSRTRVMGQQVGKPAVQRPCSRRSARRTGESRPTGSGRPAPCRAARAVSVTFSTSAAATSFPGAETPGQRGDADTGPKGDRLERRFQPALGENVPGHGHDGARLRAGVVGRSRRSACAQPTAGRLSGSPVVAVSKGSRVQAGGGRSANSW